MAVFSASSPGSIRFSYFHDLFGRLTLDPGDTITVLRRDGTIIMRRPFDLDVIGKNCGPKELERTGSVRKNGSLCRRRAVDTTPRLYVWRGSSKSVLRCGRKALGRS